MLNMAPVKVLILMLTIINVEVYAFNSTLEETGSGDVDSSLLEQNVTLISTTDQYNDKEATSLLDSHTTPGVTSHNSTFEDTSRTTPQYPSSMSTEVLSTDSTSVEILTSTYSKTEISSSSSLTVPTTDSANVETSTPNYITTEVLSSSLRTIPTTTISESTQHITTESTELSTSEMLTNDKTTLSILKTTYRPPVSMPDITSGTNTVEFVTTGESVTFYSSSERTTRKSTYPTDVTSTEYETISTNFTNVNKNTTEVPKGVNTMRSDTDDILIHLAYIIPSALFIIVATVISISCHYRHKRLSKKKKDEDDGGYVLNRIKTSSNPSFMEHNIRALAHQLNSRDSVMPTQLQSRLLPYGNNLQEIDLSEEDLRIIQKNASKQDITKDHETNFMIHPKLPNKTGIDMDKLKYEPFLAVGGGSLLSRPSLSESHLDKIEGNGTDVKPPLPGKGQTNPQKSTTESHYDTLPLRQSLPVKQRNNSFQNESPVKLKSSSNNPEYDVLPLRSFCNHQETNIPKGLCMVVQMTNLDERSDNLVTIKEKLSEKETRENSLPVIENKNESEQDVLINEPVENDILDRIKQHEPATRAPSFVVLPRAQTGSLRTAL